MPATNYTKPATGAYQLVRIKGLLAQILDPDLLDDILSHLEQTGREDLRDALYRSQPFHSTTIDPSGSMWRKGKYLSDYELPRKFLWAHQNNHLDS